MELSHIHLAVITTFNFIESCLWCFRCQSSWRWWWECWTSFGKRLGMWWMWQKVQKSKTLHQSQKISQISEWTSRVLWEMWQEYSWEILSITLSLSAPRWIWWGKGSFFNYIDKNIACSRLTLIGMRKGTFIPFSFLDWILSAEFLSKTSKLFWRWKLTSIWLIWHPAKLIESYEKCSNLALKMSIFLDIIAHANEG